MKPIEFFGLLLALAGIAISVLAPDQKLFGWAALIAGSLLSLWWIVHRRKTRPMSFLTAVFIGCVIGGITGAVIWTTAVHRLREPPKSATSTPSGAITRSAPEVSLRFVYPIKPALVIVNSSDSVAKDIKWTVALWNLDLPDRSDPLPIPVSTFDWIRPHEEGGPQDLFSGPLVAPLLKPGDRLAGSASVICPECVRGRSYLISITWGRGGWYSEIEGQKDGKVLIPVRMSDGTPEAIDGPERVAYFNRILSSVPESSRIPISGR